MSEVENASLWQLQATVEAHNAAHESGEEKPEPPSDEEFEAMKERAAAIGLLN